MAAGCDTPPILTDGDDARGGTKMAKMRSAFSFLPRGSAFICLSLRCKTSCQMGMACIFRCLKLLFGIACS